MRQTLLVAAALVGLAAPAVAQNYTIPAGDAAVSHRAQLVQPTDGFVALAPQSVEVRPVHRGHSAQRLERMTR